MPVKKIDITMVQELVQSSQLARNITLGLRISVIIIHEIFSLARDWSKFVT